MDEAQADVPELLSRLIAVSLTNAGLSEYEVSRRLPYLIKSSARVLDGACWSEPEGGGDDHALLLGLRKELETAGFNKEKLDRFTTLCNRLALPGPHPGLPPRARTGLVSLLRSLFNESRTGSGAGGSVSLAQSVRQGGLPQAYPASLGPQYPHALHQHHQQQQLPYPYISTAAAAAAAQAQQQLQQQQQLPYQRLPQRQPSAASLNSSVSGLGVPPYGGPVRPSYVVTPSEMGDDPAALMGGIGRMSLAGSINDPDYYDMRRPLGASVSGGLGGSGAGVDALMAAGGSLAPSDPALVRDVLYAARGVSGRLLAWAPEGGDAGSGFRLPPSAVAGVGAGKARLVAALTELGWLYRRVRQHVEASGPGSASVRQALGSALRAELGDFFRLLALLEAQAGCPLPSPADLANGGGGGGGQYLTPRRLLSWLSEPTQRMRSLAALGDASDGLEGGPLADAVHEYGLHGDPFVRTYMGRLLQQVCVPLYGMIRRWVLEGELDDPYEEFFVVPVRPAAGGGAAAALHPDFGGGGGGSAASSAGGGAPPPLLPPPLDLWRGSYALDESRLPRFIERPLAQRVLRAGKAIHYLKLACDDERWVLRRADEWAGRQAAGGGGEEGSAEQQLAGLDTLVSAAVRSVDGRLLGVLWRRHRLRAHWAAIRRFVLLGQGDWVTAFLDLAQPELDKPAPEVSEIKLTECLRQALTATNVLGGAGGGGWEEEGGDDGPAVALLAERLRVKKERGAGAGELGWDVFSLTYNPAAGMPGGAAGGAGGGGGGPSPLAAAAGGPLSAIFTPAVLLSYSRLARLLWRLRRAERALSATWGAATAGLQRTIDKMGADAGGVQKVLATLLRLRAEMGHFATNLQLYIQFDVMEASWQDFYSRAAACADLDSLIDAHEAHLRTLLRRALLLDDAPTAVAGGGSGGGGGGAGFGVGVGGGAGGGGGGAGGPSAAAMRRALNDMLANMVSLRAVGSKLEELVEGGARLAAANRASAKTRVERGGWGVTDAAGTAPRRGAAAAAAAAGGAGGGGGDQQQQFVSQGALADIGRTLVELRAQHQRAVAEFTENLAEEAQDDMRFLLARLDFSAKGVQTPGVVGPGPGGAVPGQLRL